MNPGDISAQLESLDREIKKMKADLWQLIIRLMTFSRCRSRSKYYFSLNLYELTNNRRMLYKKEKKAAIIRHTLSRLSAKHTKAVPEVQIKFCKFLFVCFSVQSKKCTTGAEIISTLINYQTARATTERIRLQINSCTIAKHQLNVVLHVITNKNNSINLTKKPPLISGCISQIALCVWNWRNNFSNNKNKKKKNFRGESQWESAKVNSDESKC